MDNEDNWGGDKWREREKSFGECGRCIFVKFDIYRCGLIGTQIKP